jgi:hypothetical protein
MIPMLRVFVCYVACTWAGGVAATRQANKPVLFLVPLGRCAVEGQDLVRLFRRRQVPLLAGNPVPCALLREPVAGPEGQGLANAARIRLAKAWVDSGNLGAVVSFSGSSTCAH